MVSNLGVDSRPHWQTLSRPLEARLSSRAGCTVVRPPALRRPTLRADLPAWLSAIRTLRRGDGVFWLQISSHPERELWPLLYVRPGARRAAWVIDAWRPQLRKVGLLATAQRISPLFVGFREARDVLKARHPGLDARWLPFAANADVFREWGVERDVFAYWMGRRSRELERALIEYCRARGLTYRTDRVTGTDLGRLAARSRFFVVTPPGVGDTVPTGGFSPLTSRYFEGLAAGARLLGVLPGSGEYQELLPLDVTVEVAPDGRDLADVLDAAAGDPAEEATRRAQAYVHANHTWAHRADVIYDAMNDGTNVAVAL
jgi:hypothetical protein